MDVPDKLKDLGLYPADGYESDEYFWLDSNGGLFFAGATGTTVRTLVCSTSTATTPAAMRTRPSASVPLAFGLSATLTLWTIWTLIRSSQNRKSVAF